MSALSIGKAAEQLGVHPDTVRTYLKAGKLDGWRLPSGRWRIDAADVDRLRRRTRVESDQVASLASEILSGARRRRIKSLRVVEGAGSR